jgi:hypothetical protein
MARLDYLRAAVRRLERNHLDAEDTIRIRQVDGSAAKFSPRDMQDAFMNYCDLLAASGTDKTVEVHPYYRAVENAHHNPVNYGFLSGTPVVVDKEGEPVSGRVEDLSEQAPRGYSIL